MPFNFQTVKSIQVVLEKTTTNQIVGMLSKSADGFFFEYDQKYLSSANAIPLGPEMPLTRRTYQSKELFRPFEERIPSRQNPAFPEYCQSAGISMDEQNPLILLSTIATRGPSSFLFKPIFSEDFTGSDLKAFRRNLGLSTREFAACFDFSQAGIIRVENGQSAGREILKRTEIYASYPEVALDQLRRRAMHLHWKKLEKARQFLKMGPYVRPIL